MRYFDPLDRATGLQARVAAEFNKRNPAPSFPREWLDPTLEMLKDPRFDVIWETIKSWDINVPDAYSGYCGATGNHVRAILDALDGIAK